MVLEKEEKLISVRDAALKCRRNMETVRRWIWAGKLPAQKLGNQLFIRRADLQPFCKELSTGQPKIGRHDFLKRAMELQTKIRAKTGREFDPSEVIRETREAWQAR